MHKGILAGLLLSFLAACAGQQIIITLPGGGPASNQPPRGYDLLFSPAPHAFRFVASPDPVRRGQVAERYELRDGDCGGSDCGAARARAEITQAAGTATAALNRDIWIGWSFYNDTIGPVTRDTWLGTVIGQWKLLGEQPAIFRLLQVPPDEDGIADCAASVCTPSDRTGDDVMVELDEIAQTQGWGADRNEGRICRLFSMAAVQGQWTDIVINTNFGTDGAGYLRIWVNGEMRCNYLGPMVSAAAVAAAGPGAAPNHRRGIFQSYTQRWTDSQAGAPKPTLVAYYDEFTTGLARAEVDPAARQAAGVAPIN
jgi:hypothetical protein